MVAWRKKSAVSENPVPAGGGGADALPSATAGAAAIPEAAPAAPPAEPDSELLKRMADLEKAENLQKQIQQAQQAQAQQAQINANLEREKKPAVDPPKFSERDLKFLGQRPGIDRDPRLAQTAMGLESMGVPYGSDHFYRCMEEIFPASAYRRAEEHSLTATPKAAKPPAEPQMASEAPTGEEHSQERMPDESASFVSAPISREIPSFSTGRAPQRITLTAEEREFADKNHPGGQIGYAKDKLKMLERKALGLLQDG
jgi:hypothetical protein